MYIKLLIILLIIILLTQKKEKFTPYYTLKRSYRSYPHYIGIHRYLKHYPPFKTKYYYDKKRKRFYYYDYSLQQYVYY